MRFYLGVHEPGWLAHAGVPLFVSHRRLARRPFTRLHARAPWALDSGGFTELQRGGWETPARTYADAARRYAERIGGLEWAAPQDWMCEPFMIAATGLSVREHQRRTVASVIELRAMAPEVRWIPVLQGWEADDYRRHVESYRVAGIDLAAEPVVGLGSVCRRLSSAAIAGLVTELGATMRLHAFGAKTRGLTRCADQLVSADSMAWSYNARRNGLNGNALPVALAWRGRLLAALPLRLDLLPVGHP